MKVHTEALLHYGEQLQEVRTLLDEQLPATPTASASGSRRHSGGADAPTAETPTQQRTPPPQEPSTEAKTSGQKSGVASGQRSGARRRRPQASVVVGTGYNAFHIPFTKSRDMRAILTVPENVRALVDYLVYKLMAYNDETFARDFLDAVVTDKYRATVYWPPQSGR